MSDDDNPGLAVRVGDLEVAMASVKTDIRWIKLLVAPTFLISLLSMLLLIASAMSR